MPNKILEYRRAGTRDGKTSSAGSLTERPRSGLGVRLSQSFSSARARPPVLNKFFRHTSFYHTLVYNKKKLHTL